MNRTPEQIAEDYKQFRGKCKELCEAAIEKDLSLTIVRGHYFDFIWCSDEPHWWCVKSDGTIYDPSKAQFPTNGCGIYTEFNGMFNCAYCNKEVPEEEALFYGNYAFCCSEHIYSFVM